MNRKSTSYLVLAALALLAYILVYERHTPSPARLADQMRQLLPGFDPAQVTGVEIIRSNNAVVRVERRLDHWRLTDPPYPAQSVLIEDWLNTLGRQTRRAVLSAADVQAQPGGLAGLGLAEPLARVTLQQGTRRIQLRLGGRAVLGERGYLQLVGDEQVIATESALWDRLPPTASEWRDPVFVNLAGLRFDHVVWSGIRGFELSREGTNHSWRVTQPRPARADNGRIDQLWVQLQTEQVAQFVNDFPGADLEPYGLQTPELSVVFTQGTNPVLSVEFGRSPTNAPRLVYARRSLSAGIVLVPKTLLQTLAIPYTQLLDLQLLDASLNKLSRLEARAAEEFALAKQTNGTWRVVEPRDFPADPAFVQVFLNRLQTLRIARIEKEVVTDFDLPNYGLANPAQRYRLFVPDGAPIITNRMVVGLDIGTNRADEVFVRRSDENPVYVLKRDDLQFFPLAAFELRDRRIWNFTTNEVASLTLQIKGETRKLLRSPTGEWTFAAGSQGIVNTFALEEVVFRLGQLWARAWVAQGGENLDRYGIPQIGHKLTVEFNDATAARSLTVEFGATSRTGGPFAVTTLESGPVVFEFPIEIYHVYEDVVNRMSLRSGATP